MTFKLVLNDFFFALFPNLKGSTDEQIIGYIEEYYRYGAHKPRVQLMNGELTVEIDIPTILSQKDDFRKVVNLCEKVRYDEAVPLLKNLIEKNPTNSEYHRVMGQILFDRNEIDESMDYLISALRWDNRNKSALTMMGNLLFRKKNDSDSAMKYYNQVLELNPDDYIVLNNIAVNYYQLGDNQKAKEYFEKVLTINPEYPNSMLGLSLVEESESNLYSSFDYCQKALQNDKKRELYQNILKQLFSVSKKIVMEKDRESIYQKYIDKLQYEGGKTIKTQIDDSISTIAKLEIAENYSRDFHLIKFKDSQPAYEHLIFHELVHLDLIIEARNNGNNQVFLSSPKNEDIFRKNIGTTISKLKTMGISDKNIEGYSNSMFQGLNSLIYNTPVDLFIEYYLFQRYPKLRPYQLLSLNNLILQGKNAVTDKKIIDISPKDILSKTKIYNLVSALQFKDLYGIDYISDFNPTKTELKTANEFYDEFLEYKEDRQSGEEYELVQHWADDLGLNIYFELRDEKSYRNPNDDLDKLIQDIEDDPYGLDTEDSLMEMEMAEFLLNEDNNDLNMSVVMYMTSALEFFRNKNTENVKEIAIEIALQGRLGYNPDGEYRLHSIPNKVFGGYQILSYYYVSWALAIPEMLYKLELPYDREYKLAQKLSKLE